MAYDIALTGKNEVEALNLLKESAKIIERCSINYWLDGGTLLGIIREDRLLPWDSDVDLSIIYPGEAAINQLVEAFKSSNFRVKIRTFENNSNHFTQNQIRVIKIRSKSYFGIKKRNVCLEIFIRYSKNEQTYCQVGEQVQIIPLALCQELDTVLFNNYPYSIPKETDAYLTFKYGDWKTPNKNWNVFTDDKSMNSF